MSNSINLVATTFVAHAQETKDTHGFRYYDDYCKGYCNQAEAPIEDDLELLAYAIEVGPDYDALSALLDHVASGEHGVTINGQYYDWDEIKHLVEI